MHLFSTFLNNILAKVSYLRADFIGLNIDISWFYLFLKDFLISALLIYICYRLGKKIVTFIIINDKEITTNGLILVAIGFISISFGISLIGFFSYLKSDVLLIYIVLVIIYSFLPSPALNKDLKNLKNGILNLYADLKTNKFVLVGLILFILIAFINLYNPEIREDQYHTDLPIAYLNQHTIMIPPKEALHVSGSPLMGEMFYALGISLSDKEVARHIHFMFYILVILVLLNFSKLKSYKFAVFAPLLFVTAPVVLHETSSMYVDFQWIFFFLLAVYILIGKKISYRKISLVGLLLGGMLAVKLWTIVFIPVFVIHLLIKLKGEDIKKISVYTNCLIVPIILITSVWFLRAYILTGNPLYPAFINEALLDKSVWNLSIFHYVRINYSLLNPMSNLNVFSPLFFLGLLLLMITVKKSRKITSKLDIFKISLILFFVYAFINYPYGRYLLGLYVVLIFVSSLGLFNLFHIKPVRLVAYFFVFLLFTYYFLSSLLLLPYSLGITDKNKYLSRILVRDNSSYYNFGKKFDKFITKNDLVAMYNFHGYYYADFHYIDINYIFDYKSKNFKLLKEKKVNKILIRGGDMNWFCNKIEINSCQSNNYSIISSYLEYPYYYLYNIK